MIAGAPFTREGWIFELKYDGFRVLARSGTCVQLLSRWGRPILEQFPEVGAALRWLPDATFDGELVVPTDDGRSDFEQLRLRNVLQRPRTIAQWARQRPAVLVVFDILAINGADLRTLPLLERRRALRQSIESVASVQAIEHVETHGEALFSAIVDEDHEGIVAKRIDAPYRAGRQSSWLKIKNRTYSRREAVEWSGRH